MTKVATELSLPEKIAEELKQLIYAGDLLPGERLNEAGLAVRMGTSRGPIREAIKMLSGFGLVTPVPNRGMYVRQLSVREMVEISDLRALVFGFAAGHAAEERSEKDCRELLRVLDEMDAAAASEDDDLYYRLNLVLHGLIVGLSNSERTKRLYGDFVRELHLFRRQNFSNRSNMFKSNMEHRQIVEAIVRGDKHGAARAAEQHILEGCQRMLRMADETVLPGRR